MGSDGMKMSLYGKDMLNPQEKAGLLKNVLKTIRDWNALPHSLISSTEGAEDGVVKFTSLRTGYITTKHPAILGVSDAPRHFPGATTWSRHEIDEGLKQGMYFGKRSRPTEADARTTYERLFDHSGGYDSKMHRDDRKSVHRIGCAIHEEETKRSIPLLSNSTYGHRLKTVLESFSRNHVQVEHVQKGFYYKRGTGLPPIQD